MTVPKNPDLKAMEIARIEKLFPKKMRTILGYMQLLLGDIAGLLQLQIILFGTESTKYNVSTAELGAGIWCGLVIVIAGGIGLRDTISRRSIKVLLVLSILACYYAMVLTYISWSGILEYFRQSYFDGVSRIPDSGFRIHQKNHFVG